MVLTQDLGRMVPTSRLAEELTVKKVSLKEEISALERELAVKPVARSSAPPDGVRKVQDEEGQVKIWSSSSSS